MVVIIASRRENIALYFPESFEWLILKSGITGKTEVSEILSHPEDYIESREYISWERYSQEIRDILR